MPRCMPTASIHVELHTHYKTASTYRRTPPCLPYISFFLSLVGVVSSDVTRSSCTTSFVPCWHIIFCHSYVLYFHPRMPLHTSWCYRCTASWGAPSSCPGINPIMHFLTRLHLLFLHACPKKVIFLLIVWARSSRLFKVHPVCSCLSFSPSNLSA